MLAGAMSPKQERKQKGIHVSVTMDTKKYSTLNNNNNNNNNNSNNNNNNNNPENVHSQKGFPPNLFLLARATKNGCCWF